MKKKYSLFNKLYWDNKRPLIKNEADPLPHISDKIISFSTLPSQRSFRDKNLVMLESRVPTALGTNAKRPDWQPRQAPCMAGSLHLLYFSCAGLLWVFKYTASLHTFPLLCLEHISPLIPIYPFLIFVAAPHSMWNLGDWSHAPALVARSLNHWTTREGPLLTH